MSAREDLADLLEEAIDFDIDQIADMILKAGWRPPARLIETEEEMEALPEESLVRDADGAHIIKDCGDWFQLSVGLPATVLWEPEAGDE